jgi:hypothetical protein
MRGSRFPRRPSRRPGMPRSHRYSLGNVAHATRRATSRCPRLRSHPPGTRPCCPGTTRQRHNCRPPRGIPSCSARSRPFGQSAELPLQLSATSQSPAVARHSMPASTKSSAGHAGPLPGHDSATSQSPATFRHTVELGSKASPRAHRRAAVARLGDVASAGARAARLARSTDGASGRAARRAAVRPALVARLDAAHEAVAASRDLDRGCERVVRLVALVEVTVVVRP